jgi:hypothetical protein
VAIEYPTRNSHSLGSLLNQELQRAVVVGYDENSLAYRIYVLPNKNDESTLPNFIMTSTDMSAARCIPPPYIEFTWDGEESTLEELITHIKIVCRLAE